MNFDVREVDSSIILTVRDKKLDSTNAPLLKGEFLILCTSAESELIVDLKSVELCDSSGLSALLFAERQMRENGGSLKLAALSEKVLSLIKISQLDRVFEIYDSVDDALKTGRSRLQNN